MHIQCTLYVHTCHCFQASFDSVVLENKASPSMTRGGSDNQCGISKDAQRLEDVDEDRIVGGEDVAPPHSFPWSVGLRVSWGTYFCGGAIVSPKVSTLSIIVV